MIPKDSTPRPIRRIVTGPTSDGRSTIASDGPPRRSASWPGDSTRPGLSLLWGHDGPPSVADRHRDRSRQIATFFPPEGGNRFMIERFDPGYGVDAALSKDMRDALARTGLAINLTKDAGGFHATATIDYAIVLSGRIDLVTDEAETTLEAGDVVVQTGVSHTWRNPFEEPCEMAFVLIATDSGVS